MNIFILRGDASPFRMFRIDLLTPLSLSFLTFITEIFNWSLSLFLMCLEFQGL